MKLLPLNCPACGTSLNDAGFQPDQLFSCPACQTTLVLTDLTTADQIICPSCRTINPDGQRFCDRCGSQLTIGCPFCYAQNQVEVEHCKNCGANIKRAKRRKQTWLEEQRMHEAERREAHQKALAEQRQMEIKQLLDELDEPENHPMAIYRLHQLGEEAVDALINHLTDDDPDARFGAAQTLGLIGSPQAIEPLIRALADSEPAVRYWAADALGKLRTEAAVGPLADLLKDRHDGVQTKAAQALAQIGGPEAEAALQKKKQGWWPF